MPLTDPVSLASRRASLVLAETFEAVNISVWPSKAGEEACDLSCLDRPGFPDVSFSLSIEGPPS